MPKATPAPAAAALADALQALLHGLVARRDVPHAVLAVASGDDAFRWIGAAGAAQPDGAPMQADTPYFIASIDKLFTASVILKLHERGQLRLDAPMADYLPAPLVRGLHRWRGVDYSRAITVRQLLGHTSGLADWLEDAPPGGPSMVERLIAEGDRAVALDEMLAWVRDALTPHFAPQPVAARRPKLRYSDTNYILLCAIIEAVTGQPLHRVHEQLFFQPLDLRHTWLAGHSQPLDATPAPAALWAGDQPLALPLFLRSTWAIYSTAADMLRFLRALTHGQLFDQPATFALMQQHWHRFPLPRDRAALRLPMWPIEYGLGLMRFHDPVLKFLARLPRALQPLYPAPAVIGHSGSTGSWLFYCPALDVLLAGTVDQATAGALPFRLMAKVLRVVERYRAAP